MAANAPATSVLKSTNTPATAGVPVSKVAVAPTTLAHQQNIAQAIATLTAPHPASVPAPVAKVANTAPHFVEKLSLGGIVSSAGSGLSSGVSTVGGGLTSAGSTVASGVTSGVSSLEGTVQTSVDGVQHLYKKASDAAGWVLDQASKNDLFSTSWCV
jgi:hypothetical protein